MIDWRFVPWTELGRDDLYAILAARSRVFVVEQNCPYLDLDDYDAAGWHLWTEDAGAIAAYLRILPPDSKYKEPSLGRVLTASTHRRGGHGRELMRRGIAACGGVAIRIGAQAHLEKFYGELGFVRDGDDYDEDGIPHLEMVRVSAA